LPFSSCLPPKPQGAPYGAPFYGRLQADLGVASAIQEVVSDSVVENRYFLTQQTCSKNPLKKGLENQHFGPFFERVRLVVDLRMASCGFSFRE
jgi:hypothetical protein